MHPLTSLWNLWSVLTWTSRRIGLPRPVARSGIRSSQFRKFVNNNGCLKKKISTRVIYERVNDRQRRNITTRACRFKRVLSTSICAYVLYIFSWSVLNIPPHALVDDDAIARARARAYRFSVDDKNYSHEYTCSLYLHRSYSLRCTRSRNRIRKISARHSPPISTAMKFSASAILAALLLGVVAATEKHIVFVRTYPFFFNAAPCPPGAHSTRSFRRSRGFRSGRAVRPRLLWL